MRSPIHFTFVLFTLVILNSVACSSSGPVRRTYTYDSNEEVQATHASTQASTNNSGGVKTDSLKKAQSEYSNGNPGAAIETLKNMNSSLLKPASRTEYWNLRGLAELANKAPGDAQISFQNALSANPNPAFAGYYEYNLASAYVDQKKSDDALRIINRIDLKQMDEIDQRKIALLREKLSSANPAPTPAPSSTPVKELYAGSANMKRVGLLLPLSGKYEAFGKKAQRAIELAFQNSSFVKNNEIELIPIDSGDSVITHQEALKKLVEEQKVIAVIGPLLSKGIEALSDQADFYQIPLVSIAQVQGHTSPHFFSCSISTQDQATKIASYAIKSRGFRRFAILAPSNKAGEEMAHAFWDEVLALGGEIKAFELYQPGLNDFRIPVDKTLGLFYTETRSAELEALAEKRKELEITKKTMKTQSYFTLTPIVDFDAVFIADEAKTVGQIIPTFTYRDAKNLSYLGITSWNSPQLISRSGEQAEGAAFPVAFNTLNPPDETKHFYDLFVATYTTPPGELEAVAYDTASVVLEVLKDRPATRENFNSKIQALGKIDGASGIFTVKDHHCSRDLAIYKVKKGHFESVTLDPGK